jgi:hypothetical protein
MLLGSGQLSGQVPGLSTSKYKVTCRTELDKYIEDPCHPQLNTFFQQGWGLALSAHVGGKWKVSAMILAD